MIPLERPEQRPRMTNQQLNDAITQLGLASQDIARRYRTNRLRMKAWMYGPDEDIPIWLENLIHTLKTLVAVRRSLERQQAMLHADVYGPEILAIGNLLERLCGKRFEPEKPKPERQPKAITCPDCGATSYHPKDIEEGYCVRCHDWKRDGR